MATPAFAAPLVDVSFSEGGGLTATNSGSLGGLGSFVQQRALPIFAPNAPVGTYVPPANGGAVDFGVIGTDDGGRAVDFSGSLGAMNGFTVTAWVNCRDVTVGWGGNRIVFALASAGGSGFDLVHLADGSLQLGVNQWPDGSPAVSSGGRITADPNAGSANWVFLAVTYDGTLANGQVNYYFGNPETLATLDATRDYNRGVLAASGSITVGNFGMVAGGARTETGPLNSRCFRGVMDEVKVFPGVLTLEQIQAAQTSAAVPPPSVAFITEPVDARVLAGRDATFSVSVSGGFPIYYQWQRDEQDIPGANSSSYTVPAPSVADSGARFRVIVTNTINAITSSNATLYVNSDGTPPSVVALTPTSLTNILVSFSEPVETGSAQEPGNYVLDGGNLTTYSAVLDANLTNVLLTTDAMVLGQEYVLTVQFISDRAVPVPNTMDETNVTFNAYNPPPFPPAIVSLRFSEGTGTTVTNSGTAGGTLTRSTPVPYWSNNTPPGAGGFSAIDFQTTTGNYVVESPANITQLAGLTKFTMVGWVNCRNSTVGAGGNRVVTWINGGNNGVDLVYQNDGSLRLGVNQWPDAGGNTTISSASMITTDAGASLGNWRFFAVTYDSTLASGHVKFFFGSSTADATLDVAKDYARGAVGANIHRLAIGHFNSATRSGAQDRMFRGLIDEVQIFGEALTPEEVVNVQRANAAEPKFPVAFTSEPIDQQALAGYNATFTASVTGTLPIYYQWQRDEVNISGANGPSYTVFTPMPADNGARFRVIVTNEVTSITSSNATLTVLTDETAPTVVAVRPMTPSVLVVSFSEPVAADSAQGVANYVLDNGNLNVVSATLENNLTNVVLATAPMTAAAAYTLTIQSVYDRAVPTANQMVMTNWSFTAYTPPVMPVPFFSAQFEEGSGNTVANSGSAGLSGTIDPGLGSSVAGLPMFTNNVPLGNYAPSGNNYSLYFGTGSSSGSYAGKAVDFPDQVRTNLVGLTQFTITGWLNKTDVNAPGGGTRIISCWPQALGGDTANRLTGIDLVVADSTRLRLGVNQAPDYPQPPTGPYSGNKLTTSAAGDPANWIFFAVTYDGSLSSANVRYYFGNPNAPAAQDLTGNYTRGMVTNCTAPVSLTLGNFNDSPAIVGDRDSTGTSRTFRGLIDDIRVYSTALNLQQVQHVQISGTAAAPTPPGIQNNPVDVTVFEGQPAAFSAIATGSPPMTVKWERNGVAVDGATSLTLSLPIVTLADDGAAFRLVATNPQGTATSTEAILHVLPETGLKVRFAFEEAEGTTTTNLGNLLGNGVFTQTDSLPVFASNVPVGPYAPTGNVASVDFGTVAAGQNGRAIDLSGALMPSLGAMNGFTVSGWLNARDLAVGWGGNRIVFALDAENGRGFDLVHQADGALRLGVNQWPDAGTGGPISSVNKLTADPAAGPDNWVFFAVTYDSTVDHPASEVLLRQRAEPCNAGRGARLPPRGN